jgi:vacuolar protein sorting-associated protein 8
MEQIILHLDIGSIDFHQVVKLCQKHYLSSALFFLYISALSDYITPMDFLMRVLVKDSHLFGTPEQMQRRKAIGYKLLVYLGNVFAGKDFPAGTAILRDRVDSTKSSVYDYLLVDRVLGEPDSPIEKYPRVSALLHVDAQEFFRVLAVGIANQQSPYLGKWIHVLTELLVDQSPAVLADPSIWNERRMRDWPYTSTQVGYFLQFLASVLARGLCQISEFLLARVLAYLLHSEDATSKKTREQLVLDIISSPHVSTGRLVLDQILVNAEQGSFFKVCEYFYRKTRDFAQVIRCHLRDPDLQRSCFDFIRTLMQDGGLLSLTAKEKESVKNTVLGFLSEIVKIDSDAASALVSDCFATENERVVRELEPFPELQFAYLKSIQQQVKNGRDSIQISVAMGEKYLELLCKFDKDGVKEWLSDSNKFYRLDTAISLTARHAIMPAYCMLLELAGELSKALEIHIQGIDKQVQQLFAYIRMLDGSVAPVGTSS